MESKMRGAEEDCRKESVCCYESTVVINGVSLLDTKFSDVKTDMMSKVSE